MLEHSLQTTNITHTHTHTHTYIYIYIYCWWRSVYVRIFIQHARIDFSSCLWANEVIQSKFHCSFRIWISTYGYFDKTVSCQHYLVGNLRRILGSFILFYFIAAVRISKGFLSFKIWPTWYSVTCNCPSVHKLWQLPLQVRYCSGREKKVFLCLSESLLMQEISTVTNTMQSTWECTN